MPFNIADEVDELDWDFSTLKRCPAVLQDARGTIPEPTTEQINQFTKRWQALLVAVSSGPAAAESVEEPEPGTMLQQLETWRTSKVITRAEEAELSKAFVELQLIICKGEGAPTRKQLEALPHRPREAFLLWLIRELIVPKAAMEAWSYGNATSETTSTNGVPVTVPGA